MFKVGEKSVSVKGGQGRKPKPHLNVGEKHAQAIHHYRGNSVLRH